MSAPAVPARAVTRVVTRAGGVPVSMKSEAQVFPALRMPAPVRRGADIRIVSPAMPTLAYVPDRADRAERALNALGFTVSYGSRAHAIGADGLSAGTARDRADDLMEAFTDPSVGAILAADAGTGSADLLEYLDPVVIAANAKPFIGYCDNVSLNQFLAVRAGITSLYGCTFMIHMGEAGGVFAETAEYLTRVLAAEEPLVCTPVGTRTSARLRLYEPEHERAPRHRDTEGGWMWLRSGAGRGAAVSAEITMVPTLSEEFGIPLDGTVLFWDVAYHGFDVPSLFKDVCDRVDLSRLAGMVVGAHPGVAPMRWAETVDDLLEEFLPGAGFPVVVNSDLSHRHPSWTVPFGEEVVVAAPGPIVFPRRPVASGGAPPC